MKEMVEVDYTGFPRHAALKTFKLYQQKAYCYCCGDRDQIQRRGICRRCWIIIDLYLHREVVFSEVLRPWK